MTEPRGMADEHGGSRGDTATAADGERPAVQQTAGEGKEHQHPRHNEDKHEDEVRPQPRRSLTAAPARSPADKHPRIALY